MTRRWWWVGAGTLLALTGLTWWLLAGGDRGAAIANVLALPVAVVGLAIAAVSLARSASRADQVRVAARDLAEAVAQRESAALQQLLGDVGDPRPANIGFRQPLPVRWRTDGGQQQGDLAQVAGYYRELTRGRLVVLGEPGSGKTVLAVQLIIDLLKDGVPGDRIPVRLSLPTFDPFPGGQTAVSNEELARRLDAWMVHELTTLGIGKLAVELIARGWILPVLDGLDEMDFDDAPPDRAAAVIRALNVTAGTRPVVLACRRARYDQFPRPAVQDATVVVLDSLTPLAARDYLTHRFPHPDGLEPRWRALADAMTPAGPGAWPHPLVEALRSPWRLFLCITAFADAGDPYEQLGDLSPEELTDALLERLIPAAVDQHPAPDGQCYSPTKVTTWLTTLAVHLDSESKRGYSRSDILLNELWRTAGPRAPRYISATALLTTAALPIVLLIGLPYLRTVGFPPITPAHWIGLISSVLIGLILWIQASTGPTEVTRLDTSPLHTRQGRRRLIGTATFGLTLGILTGLAIELQHRVVPGGFGFELPSTSALVLMTGTVSAGAALLSAVLAASPSYVSAPSQLVRQGITRDVTAGLTLGLLASFVAWFVGGPVPGLSLGFGGGILTGVVVWLSPWPRYFVAVLMLHQRGVLPLRPAQFLDWAYSAGLMRLSGIGIQFRHQEFQTWLTMPRTSAETMAAIR